MTRALILVVAVVVVGLRLWMRRRNRSSEVRQSHLGLGPFSSDVGLVAAREVRERFRGRIFRVGTLFILLVVAAAILIPKLDHSTPQPEQVGVVGPFPPSLRAIVLSSAKSVGTTVAFVPEADVSAAHDGLRSGRLDLAIVDGRTLVVNTAIGPNDTSNTASLATALATNLGVVLAMQEAHLTPSQASSLLHAKPLPVESLQGGSSSTHTVHPASIIGLILVFVMLNQYNTWILIGVMEEKSSRVVEVLLAVVRPIELLTGKVLGIGLMAFAQATLIVGFALLLAEIVGSTLLQGTAPLVLVSTLVWLVLGYAFYCWVYAAAGSMAERQDQVQTLAFPLSLPIIFGYIVALTTASSGNASAFFKVLAYLPPTAPFAMPVLVSFGEATWWEFCASAAISIVATVGVARVATGIYRRAILRTGRRVPIRELFSSGR